MPGGANGGLFSELAGGGKVALAGGVIGQTHSWHPTRFVKMMQGSTQPSTLIGAQCNGTGGSSKNLLFNSKLFKNDFVR